MMKMQNEFVLMVTFFVLPIAFPMYLLIGIGDVLGYSDNGLVGFQLVGGLLGTFIGMYSGDASYAEVTKIPPGRCEALLSAVASVFGLFTAILAFFQFCTTGFVQGVGFICLGYAGWVSLAAFMLTARFLHTGSRRARLLADLCHCIGGCPGIGVACLMFSDSRRRLPVWAYGDVWAKRLAAMSAVVGKWTGEPVPNVVIIDWLARPESAPVQAVGAPVRIALRAGIEVKRPGQPPSANGKEELP